MTASITSDGSADQQWVGLTTGYLDLPGCTGSAAFDCVAAALLGCEEPAGWAAFALASAAAPAADARLEPPDGPILVEMPPATARLG